MTDPVELSIGAIDVVVLAAVMIVVDIVPATVNFLVPESDDVHEPEMMVV